MGKAQQVLPSCEVIILLLSYHIYHIYNDQRNHNVKVLPHADTRPLIITQTHISCESKTKLWLSLLFEISDNELAF